MPNVTQGNILRRQRRCLASRRIAEVLDLPTEQLRRALMTLVSM